MTDNITTIGTDEEQENEHMTHSSDEMELLEEEKEHQMRHIDAKPHVDEPATFTETADLNLDHMLVEDGGNINLSTLTNHTPAPHAAPTIGTEAATTPNPLLALEGFSFNHPMDIHTTHLMIDSDDVDFMG